MADLIETIKKKLTEGGKELGEGGKKLIEELAAVKSDDDAGTLADFLKRLRSGE